MEIISSHNSGFKVVFKIRRTGMVLKTSATKKDAFTLTTEEMVPGLVYRILDKDVNIVTHPLNSKGSSWSSPGTEMPSERWVLLAGSSCYQNTETKRNYWLEHRIISLDEGAVDEAVYPSEDAADATRATSWVAAQEKIQNIRSAAFKQRNKYDVIHRTNILNVKNPDDQLCYCDLQLVDMRRLLDGDQLNDQIVNTYIGMLNLRNHQGKNKTFIMDTHHWPFLLRNCNNEELISDLLRNCNTGKYVSELQKNINYRNDQFGRWRINMNDKDLIIIPIHSRYGTHWEMCVIDFKYKCIRYYDSKDIDYYHTIDSNTKVDEKTVISKVIFEWMKSLWGIKPIEWQTIVVSKRQGHQIPSQHDSNELDCGVLMLKYIESIVLGEPLGDMCAIFTKGDIRMRKYRENLAKALLCN